MANEQGSMTVVEHLTELRRRIIIMLVAWLVPTLVLVSVPYLRFTLLDLVERPVKQVLAQIPNKLTATPIFTKPTEGITIPLKLAAIAGLVVGLPIILWQVWLFVSPALRPAERKFALPFVVSSVVLFLAGAAFAYFIMPIGLGFLGTFLGNDALFLPDLNEYLSFFTLLIVVFGVTFELPVALVLLGLLGIVSSRKLRKHRRVIYIGIIFASLIMTPGADPFSPTLLAIPLLLLFEASILVLDKLLKR